MGRRLRSVYEHRHAVLMRYAHNLLHGVHCSERIAHVSHTNNLRFLREQLLVCLHVELSAVVHRNHLQRNAAFRCLQLPGNDVRVVLHYGHYHLIAFRHERFAERRSHEIDALGCAAREDYLFCLRRVDKLTHGLACRFVQVGGALREIVYAAVHIGVGVEILFAHGVEHAQRLLRGSSVVEIDERTVVDGARKDWEIGANLIYIVHDVVKLKW